ncbi:hypothetical protein QBC32DRAFT_371835 [Pseudoneurospora amorphoporcata]|uniref:Uncharacterized protein n=1 Tax=Pseudoneurospora amorphoporcata TaxID=241081 RepID=A0AAN6NT71_9PEZI|nr:hypothetical protein QBC32DRAFT_371835 [Pseudoneurospora amorphoporcata]
MSSYHTGGAGNAGSGNRSSSGGGNRPYGSAGSTSGAGAPPASGQASRTKTKISGSMMDRYLHDTTTQVSDRFSGHQNPISNDRHRSEVLRDLERRKLEAERLARLAKGN